MCTLQIFFCFFLSEIRAQYNQYTYLDDIGINDITSLNITSDGILWTADLSGNLIKYDGKTIKKYHVTNLDFSPFRNDIIEHNERLWLMSIESEVMLFNNESWKVPTPEAEVKRIIIFNHELIGLNSELELYKFNYQKDEWTFLSKLQIDTDKFQNLRAGIFNRPKNEIWVRIFSDEKPNYNDYYKIKDIKNGDAEPLFIDIEDIVWFDSYNHYMVKNEDRIEIFKDGKKSYLAYDDGSILESLSFLRSFEDIIVFDLVPLPGEKEQKILNIATIDEQGNLKPLAKILNNYIPFGISFDEDNNIWLASQTGLIKVNPYVTNFFDWHPNMIGTLHTVNEDGKGNIWFGGYSEGFCYYDGEKLHPSPTNLQGLIHILPGSFRNEDGEMYQFEEKMGFIKICDNNWELINPKNGDDKMIGYIMNQVSENNLALGLSKNGIALLDVPIKNNQNWKFIADAKGLDFKSVLDVAVDKAGRLWSTSLGKGIALYDPKMDTTGIWLDGSLLNEKIGGFSIHSDKTGNIWLGTPTGLCLLKSPHEIPLFAEKLQLYLSRIEIPEAGKSKIKSLDTFQNYLVFTNEMGHGFFDFEEFYKSGRPKACFFNTSDDLEGGAGVQNAIYTDTKGKLWIGKDRGAVRMDMNRFCLDTDDVQIIIDTINSEANDISNIQKQGITLTYEDRSLYIYLKQKTYRITNDQVLYHYLLTSEDNMTPLIDRLDPEGKFRIDYLGPGKYTLHINAFKNNLSVYSLSIPVTVPYTWFVDPNLYNFSVSMISLLIISFIYLLYRMKIREGQSQLQLSKMSAKVDQMQVKAITSALNPHFINNSLHWIQSKVRQEPELVKVIGKMSENIRMVFKQSRLGVPFHSLRDEVKLVDNYLQIQHARYGVMLESKIPNYEELGSISEVNVPVMQIQIHVENAIEHGIRNRIQANTVEVSITEIDDFIIIKIIDDGIGRQKAKEMQSKGTQQGVAMLDSIHKIFNSNNKNKISYWYVDLPFVDEVTGEEYGTIVTIQIPKEYRYEIK